MNNNYAGNMYMKTSFRNGGRRAGNGVISDDYSEESMGCRYTKHERVRFPNDGRKPEELNGPVISYKAGANKT